MGTNSNPHAVTLNEVRRQIAALKVQLTEAESAERYLARLTGDQSLPQQIVRATPPKVTSAADQLLEEKAAADARSLEEQFKGKSWHEAVQIALNEIGSPTTSGDILDFLEAFDYLKDKKKMTRNVARNSVVNAMTRKEAVFAKSGNLWSLREWDAEK